MTLFWHRGVQEPSKRLMRARRGGFFDECQRAITRQSWYKWTTQATFADLELIRFIICDRVVIIVREIEQDNEKKSAIW